MINMSYYNRYDRYISDGENLIVKTIDLPKYDTDLYIIYDKSKDRFDNLSYKYYGDANYAWLILLANQKYGSCEFSFPDKIKLRIPYPLREALNRYENVLD